ncbi:MAG: hypothetical protein ABEJ84_03850 [Halodesulfurarchaeum sp.]
MSDESDSELDGPRGETIREASTLQVSTSEGFVHDTVLLKGINLPANETLTVTWRGFDGTWRMGDSGRVMGPQFRVNEEERFTVETDQSRSFKREWTVEENFGGEHAFELWAGDVKLDTASFHVHPHFELDRTEAPVGETFRLTGYGLGSDQRTSLYQVTWDSAYVGYMIGVMERGTATAEIRAAGPPGDHTIGVWRNYAGIPLLQNYTQTPAGDISPGRPTDWTVQVTEPDDSPPVMETEAMFPEDPNDAHIPDVEASTGSSISVEPSSGRPGTDAVVSGRGFPPSTPVELTWFSRGGEQFAGAPVGPAPRPDVLPDVTTDEEGTFQVDITVPSDVGATRPIHALVDGQSVAATGFVLQPEAVDITPRSGPVGTEITVSVTGIGWQQIESAYAVLYDNKPTGYVIGDLADEGLVEFTVQASGEPGYHFIDLVPLIHDTETADLDLDYKPHLSYLDNHPGRLLPGIGFTFEVTN